MTQSLTCVHGHSWNDEGVADSFTPAQPRCCPVCGSAATQDTLNQASADFPTSGDSLPPAPGRPVPSPTLFQDDSRPEIPGFEILGELGRGGMGIVYRARQKSLDRIVALKMLLAGPLAGLEDLARLRVEAESIARLQHPNIVHVYDIGEHKGWTYISLEFVEGGSLSRRLDGRPKSADEAAELTEILARAVHVAHQRGIVHRDLKPANVLLTDDGTPKISDFGLAKQLDREAGHTRSGAIMGTPSYMAPEQADGRTKSIGPPTDVYALGAILYELLTGRPPFQSDSAFEIMLHVVQTQPTPPSRINSSVPPRIEQICLKCLEKEPARRYSSTLELADELKRFRAEPRITVAATKPAKTAVPKWFVPAAACIGILIVGGLIANSFRPRSAGTSSPTTTPLASTPIREPAAAQGVVSIGRDGDKFDRIAFPTRTIGYAASREGLYKTVDGGTSWTALPIANPGRVHFLVFEDKDRGWIGTNRLLRTEDGGTSWSPVEFPGAASMAAVTGFVVSPDGTAFAGGTAANGKLQLFHREGVSEPWQLLEPEKAGYGKHQDWYLGALAFRGTGSVFAALFRGSTEGGALLSTSDGGKTWSPVFQSERDLYRVHFVDGKRGWLTGSNGGLWTTPDGGTSWNAIGGQDSDVAVSALSFAPNGRFGIAPLWQGQALVTSDGASWKQVMIADQFGYSMPCAVVFDDGAALILSANGQIARWQIPSQSP